MIKFVIAFVTTFHVLFAYGNNGHAVDLDSLTFVQIGNIKYDTGKLYLTFQIHSDHEELEKRKFIRKEYELPKKDAINFLKLVNELELTSIRSNDRIRICNGCSYFSMEYIRGSIKRRIGVYLSDMSPDELERWRSYEKRIDSTLAIDHWQELFRAELPDGRYSASRGMLSNHYLKEDGQWFDLSQHPLYLLDNVEISHLKASRLALENYQVEKLEGAAAAAIYGARGAQGVVVIRTVGKKEISRPPL